MKAIEDGEGLLLPSKGGPLSWPALLQIWDWEFVARLQGKPVDDGIDAVALRRFGLYVTSDEQVGFGLPQNVPQIRRDQPSLACTGWERDVRAMNGRARSKTQRQSDAFQSIDANFPVQSICAVISSKGWARNLRLALPVVLRNRIGWRSVWAMAVHCIVTPQTDHAVILKEEPMPMSAGPAAAFRALLSSG